MEFYNHNDKSHFSLEECEDAIGKRFTLPLTGTVISAGESSSGPYVVFEVDECWGFGETTYGLDLDALIRHGDGVQGNPS